MTVDAQFELRCRSKGLFVRSVLSPDLQELVVLFWVKLPFEVSLTESQLLVPCQLLELLQLLHDLVPLQVLQLLQLLPFLLFLLKSVDTGEVCELKFGGGGLL